ncbi:hypothetical protein [Rhodophyticola sp.]|jgi:2-polyprenyl-6-methoxyphenol hydroxylase-like FAD-dependent oxidoreductase|uniref:FAD binding domain-containing protein n=1 Tax=Rhodophyticola sp. TaxID=2680032 RepID=UPI003D27DAEE
MPEQFTSWEAIFASLSGAFPAERYHAGMELEIAEATANGVTLRANRETLTADLLIAADGFRSETQARFAPETISRYAGYIAWRGVADETDLPDALVAFFDDNFCFCDVGGGGHALCYLIPSEGGSTAKGTRRLNWVWYVTVPEGESLNSVMTDGAGRQRHASVPAGHVNATALNDLHRRAENLEPHFADLVRATPEPFIQSIFDVAPPEMVFGRVCLLGDAAFVVRPHTAATAKAAADASEMKVFGRAGSTAGSDIRDYLSRTVIAFDWVELENAGQCRDMLGIDSFETLELPIVEFPDGERIFAPKPQDIAARLGWVTAPKHEEYDLSIYGGGPSGLSAAVYAASEGLRTILTFPNRVVRVQS